MRQRDELVRGINWNNQRRHGELEEREEKNNRQAQKQVLHSKYDG